MRDKRLYSYKNENILYENRCNSILLELWLGKNEDYIFDILKEIGIECSFIIVKDCNSRFSSGEREYKLECLCNEYKLILKGSLNPTKLNPKTIKVVKEEVIKRYDYVCEVLEQKQDIRNTLKENNKELVSYQSKKTKRYLKEFFNNDDECEAKLIDILKSLGVNRIYGIQIHDLTLVKEFPFSVKEFSIACSCLDKEHTKLMLSSKKEKIGYSRKINVTSDEKNVDFDYNVYTDELVHKQKTLEKKLK